MIRLNLDIRKIVVHHTGTNSNTTGEEHNKDHMLAEEFGSPFDILINTDGKIDLSPQWIYAADATQYQKDTHFTRVIASESHYLAAIGKTLEQKKNMVHIAAVGNFDTRYPSPYQINGLLKTIEFLCRGLRLCVKRSLFYYSEFYLTPSPGIHFPSKENLIAELSTNKSLQNLC